MTSKLRSPPRREHRFRRVLFSPVLISFASGLEEMRVVVGRQAIARHTGVGTGADVSWLSRPA